MIQEKHMRFLTLQQAADYLVVAENVQTQQIGFCTVNSGMSESGFDFVLVANMFGEVMLTEGL